MTRWKSASPVFAIVGLSIFFIFIGCQTPPRTTTSESLHSILRTASADGQGALYSEEHLDFKKWGRTSDCCSAQGKKIAIAAGGSESAKAGLAIYEAGGNIVDVAVATAFCLAVERPHSTGIGGGGFMALHLAKGNQDVFVDFRETAPHAATREMFVDESGTIILKKNTEGALAVATPGFVAGLYDVHKKYGKLPWKRLLATAVRLADEGITVYPNLTEAIDRRKEVLLKDPYFKKLLFHEDGKALDLGEKLVQPELATTLETIGKKGKRAFYSGKFAQKIAAYMKANGGIVDATDLKNYTVKFPEPLKGTFQKYSFTTAPPPSAGGVLLVEMLNVLGGYDLTEQSNNPAGYLNLLSEVMKRAYADRSKFIGDPAFGETGFEKLITLDYAKAIRQVLDVTKATPSAEIRPGALIPQEDHGTTQLSIIDSQGNAVSATLTINSAFGAGIVVPELGLILNDEMDDFNVKPGGTDPANDIEPLKRPVSSMVPTIIYEDGTPILAIGAGGGPRIISSVTQVLINDLILYKGDLRKSIFAPRIHQQWQPDKLSMEPGFPGALALRLRELGNETVESWVKEVQAAQWNPKTEEALAVFDPRDLGGAEAK